MATEHYQSFRFTDESLALIKTMNAIIIDYTEQGFKLTVRQLYYQLVARDVIPNTEKSYKKVTNLVNDARLAGVMDWEAIEDRTRAFVRRQRWESGRQILEASARSFHIDMWENQDERPFVIIEKEALVGVLEPICQRYDVPILAARGYPSASVLREFAVDDIVPAQYEQKVIIIHLGDHDPSGIDMSRDLGYRISLFAREPVSLIRIALNMPQIEERKPPPNPAKTTDSRFNSYRELFGNESWELDALPPQYLSELVERQIKTYIDPHCWNRQLEKVKTVREKIEKIAKRFNAS